MENPSYPGRMLLIASGDHGHVLVFLITGSFVHPAAKELCSYLPVCRDILLQLSSSVLGMRVMYVIN